MKGVDVVTDVFGSIVRIELMPERIDISEYIMPDVDIEFGRASMDEVSTIGVRMFVNAIRVEEYNG